MEHNYDIFDVNVIVIKNNQINIIEFHVVMFNVIKTFFPKEIKENLQNNLLLISLAKIGFTLVVYTQKK